MARLPVCEICAAPLSLRRIVANLQRSPRRRLYRFHLATLAPVTREVTWLCGSCEAAAEVRRANGDLVAPPLVPGEPATSPVQTAPPRRHVPVRRSPANRATAVPALVRRSVRELVEAFPAAGSATELARYLELCLPGAVQLHLARANRAPAAVTPECTSTPSVRRRRALRPDPTPCHLPPALLLDEQPAESRGPRLVSPDRGASRVTVLCVDDDPLVREYLWASLSAQSEIDLAGVVKDAAAAADVLLRQSIDVLVTDYRLARAEELEELLRVVRSTPSRDTARPHRPALLFCTGFADEQLLREARALGARGIVPKDRVHSDLLPAIRSLASGASWFRL